MSKVLYECTIAKISKVEDVLYVEINPEIVNSPSGGCTVKNPDGGFISVTNPFASRNNPYHPKEGGDLCAAAKTGDPARFEGPTGRKKKGC